MALTYSTFLGGSRQDQATKVLVEPSGHVAVTGYTLSNNFPVTPDALQSTQAGNGDVFLTILDPSAQDFTKALVYSTYFGGSDGDVPYDLRRDAAGKYYLCGYTLSLDLPIQNALSPASDPGNSVDGFVAVIDPAASPLKAPGLLQLHHRAGISDRVRHRCGRARQYLRHRRRFGRCLRNHGPAAAADNSNLNVFLLVFTLP